jgi:hypothetical protein
MDRDRASRLTLDHPVVYQIKVPGAIDFSGTDWAGEMSTSVQNERGNAPVTLLTGRLDQAGLYGLLRRLYQLGLPLISVVCLEFE